MTIRQAIEELLAGHGTDRDPAAVLAGHGYDGLPTEALSSALVHFAERSPLDVADVLAPIVTRLSPVPFGAGDLDADAADAVLAEGGDLFDLLDRLDLADEDPGGGDPSDFDAEDLAAAAADFPADALDDLAQRLAAGFGRGHDPDPASDDSDEVDDVLSLLDEPDLVPVGTDLADDAEVTSDLLDDLVEALPVDFDDPADDDFDTDDLDLDLD